MDRTRTDLLVIHLSRLLISLCAHSLLFLMSIFRRWFDHNWAFTVPGPRMPFDTKDAYEGMSGQVWGSHVYYESTRRAYQDHGITTRPIALSRDNGPNWRAPAEGGDIRSQCLEGAGSPAHHRFPVSVLLLMRVLTYSRLNAVRNRSGGLEMEFP